jgi:hypothetical protein
MVINNPGRLESIPTMFKMNEFGIYSKSEKWEKRVRK